jgi:ribosomal protein S18 acetylase RimI-like enzyme
MILTCQYIDTPDPAFLTLDPGYEATFLTADELDRYVAQPECGLTDRFVARELAVGHECFAIRQGDALAAYGWYATTATHFTDDLSVHFGRGWVYMYKGFTHPAYRGRRLHAIGMTMALTLYRARGFRGLVSIVTADNSASLASCARMGYRRFGTIYTMRPGRLLRLGRPTWLDRVLVFTTPGCKAFGFRLDRSDVAVPLPAVSRPAPAPSASHVSRLP